jgi:hypothetical protein
MIKRIGIPALAILSVLAFIWVWPMPTQGAAIHTPTYVATVPVSLPPCENEDGSGQMLCMWDASESGNGEGVDAIGGDCSEATLGDAMASAWCVRLYAMPATHTDNADGSSVDVPNGEALVSECTDIAFEASQDKAMANELDNDGWNLTECFKAFIEN